MITAAKNEEGTGLLELVVFLPLLLLFFYLMFNLFYTINTSIVAQTWTRSKLNEFLGNSAYYPVATKRDTLSKLQFVHNNQFYIGLHETTFEETQTPTPMKRMIVPNSDKPKAQVRTLIGICTYDVMGLEKNQTQANDGYAEKLTNGSGNPYCQR